VFSAKKPDGPVELEKSSMSTVSTTNARTFAAHADAGAQNCSIINEWLTMRGDLESEGDILIKGKVHGNITCKLLIIDTEAMIEGGINCDDVVIRGATRGIINAKRVRLEKTANVDGEIFQETFSAEEGARIRGALRHSDELKTAAPEQKPGSLYQLLDAARTAQHATPAVTQ
jgi:cytoskeletal protein CcmA (bactofilin family)